MSYVLCISYRTQMMNSSSGLHSFSFDILSLKYCNGFCLYIWGEWDGRALNSFALLSYRSLLVDDLLRHKATIGKSLADAHAALRGLLDEHKEVHQNLIHLSRWLFHTVLSVALLYLLLSWKLLWNFCKPPWNKCIIIIEVSTLTIWKWSLN